MKAFKNNRGLVSVIAICCFIVQFTHAKAATASIIDVGNVAARSYDQDLAEFLTYRNTESSPILQKATIIFQTKLSDSTPLQDAALELLKTCKSAEELSTPTTSADSIRDGAKSTYAIKAALILLASASVSGPATCNGFGVHSARFTFLSAVIGSQSQNSPPSASDRSLCVRDLYKTDNSWTSYSNALQDANTLCQVPSLETAQRVILDLINDMNQIIPAWLDIFDQKQKAHLEFMRQQKTRAEDLDKLQRRQRENMENNHDAAKSAMNSMMDATKSHVQGMTSDLRDEIDSAGIGMAQLQQAVNNYIVDFLMLKEDQNRIFQAYQSTFSDAVALQSQGMVEVQDTVRSVVQSLNHVFGGLEEVHVMSVSLRSELYGVVQLQKELKGGQEELLGYQAETIQHQKEISAFASQLKGQVADLTTVMSAISKTLGPIGQVIALVLRGDLSPIGRAVLFLDILAMPLVVFVSWKASLTSISLSILLWLASPYLQQMVNCLRGLVSILGAYLAIVGHDIATQAIMVGHALLALTNVIYLIAALASVLAAYAIFQSYKKTARPRTATFVNTPKVKVRQDPRGHGFRAATLPPQPKPKWLV